MAYALLGFFVVLVIAHWVLIWKASPYWRWYQIVPVVLTMILAVVFVYPTAGALKSRQEWHKIKEDLEAQIEQVRREQQELRYGDPNDPLADDGLLPLAQKLSILGTEAGRRWRNLQLVQQNIAGNGTVVLEEPAGDGGLGGDPAAGQPANTVPLIPQDLVVYGFAEAVDPNLQATVPTDYLGEFRVQSSTPTQVTIVPTGPLLSEQQEMIRNGEAGSWSIYEMLPLDGHLPFVAEGSTPDSNNVFGRIDEDLIRRVMGDRVDEATLAEYLEDGRRSQPDDPPLSRWVKVKFTKKHSIMVDSPDQRSALDGGYFDGSGRAVDSRLQQGDDGVVTFDKDDELILKEEAAAQLFDEGVATLVDTYYLRPMNDYRFVLRRIRLRLAELQQRTTELQFEQDVLQRAVDATVQMLTANQTDKLKLEQDLQQTEVERKALEQYNESLDQRVSDTKQRILTLYRSNQDLESQLEVIHDSITREVDSMTASASATPSTESL